MQSASRKNETTGSEQAAPKSSSVSGKKAKLSVLLVTRDDMLWPQVGGHLSKELILKQVDSVDELLTATTAGQAAIVLWDARKQTDSAAVLSRLQLHSPRFAVVVLDEAGAGDTWTNPIALRQVVAHVPVPVPQAKLNIALDSAQEEVNARVALLGENGPVTAPGAVAPSSPRRIPWIQGAIIAVVLIAGVVGYELLTHRDATATHSVAPAANPAIDVRAPQQAAKTAAAADEKVDALIEKAQQAMLERHYIDPAEGSALSLYRGALLLDPTNGEARQGLQRLAEVLFARVQSALDERKFDVALQSLETARSISPGRQPLVGARCAHREHCGPSSVRRRFWRPSPRRTSIARRS